MLLVQYRHDGKAIVGVLHVNVGGHQRVTFNGKDVLRNRKADANVLAVDVGEVIGYLRCEEGGVCGRLHVRGAGHDCGERCHVRVKSARGGRWRRRWWW